MEKEKIKLLGFFTKFSTTTQIVIMAISIIIMLGITAFFAVNLYEESDFAIFEYSKKNISYDRLRRLAFADLLPLKYLPVDTKYNVRHITGRDYDLIISFKLPKNRLNEFMQHISNTWGKDCKLSPDWGDGKKSSWGYRIPTTAYDLDIDQLPNYPDYYVYPSNQEVLGGWFVIPVLEKVIFYTYSK